MSSLVTVGLFSIRICGAPLFVAHYSEPQIQMELFPHSHTTDKWFAKMHYKRSWKWSLSCLKKILCSMELSVCHAQQSWALLGRQARHMRTMGSNPTLGMSV
jgi:hypothetical protein